MPDCSITSKALNMAQLYFQGTSENKFLIFGFKSKNPLLELIIPLCENSTENLKLAGAALGRVGSSEYCLATRTTDEDSREGLWLMTKHKDGSCTLYLYHVETGLGGIYLRAWGCISETEHKGSEIPALLQFINPGSHQATNSAALDRRLPQWLLENSMNQRIASTLN